jgi:hypothetical protein
MELHSPSENKSELIFARTLSARHGQSVPAGTWDFVHVAAALSARPDAFVTCDGAQAELARTVGLTRVHLFE